ncbi:hypothetical protein Daus18300_014045 [Diaporthe australafricana]|uniref:NACHT domain-containing protein n=1 Tax=Diaporthe australafricana TaxID=127596 RepID=A0ABR3VWN9_9PEZI
MAEGLAVFALTCNIIQIIETGYNVVKNAKAIYNSSGSTDVARNIRLLLEDVKATAEDVHTVTNTSTPLSADEKAIKGYSVDCEEIVTQLLAILAVIEPRQGASFRSMESMRVSTQLARKKNETTRLLARLQSLDDRLRERLYRIVDERRHSTVTALLQRLNAEAIVLTEGNDSHLDKLRRAFQQNIATKCELEVLKLSIEELAAESTQVARTVNFLKTLRFLEIQHRLSTIDDAHKSTIQWAFDKSCSTFPEWLESDSGIYWVTGLAGSGKSTYMKYIASHKSTAQILRTWSGGDAVNIAKFFFWNLGSAMQKSQQGLYQTLLYQIFRSRPDLIQKLCPDRDELLPWTRAELADVFDRIATFDFGPTRFCFFIDGLDEYDGEEDDVIEAIRKIAACPSIKVCISSRPWNAFRDEFGKTSYKHAMEDLTESDINDYISKELTSHDLFVACLEKDPRFGSTSEQLTKRAKGVWLWVYLIIKGLKRDLRSREEFDHWQRRIDSVPPDLEEFFRRMLARLDPIHRIQTARTFLVVLFGEQIGIRPFSTDMYTCLQKEASNSHYLDDMPFLEFSKDKHGRTYLKRQRDDDSNARRHINGRCRDLLHVQGDGTLGIYRNRLEFLHRTARDFFRDTYYKELHQATGTGFVAAKSIVQMYLAMLKVHPLDLRYLPKDQIFLKSLNEVERVAAQKTFHADFSQLLADFWKVVSHDEALFEPSVFDKFDELACKRLTKQWVTVFHSMLFDEVFFDDRVRMIAWCLCMRLNQYVKSKWEPRTYGIFLERQWSPLRISLPRMQEERDLDEFATPIFNEEMLRALLDSGVSPNEPHFIFDRDDPSAGYMFLGDVMERRYLGDKDSDQSSNEILRIEEDVFKAVEMLLQAGLDLPPGPQEPGSTKSWSHLNEANFQDRMAIVFGDRKAHMLQEMYEQRH